jgi:hypothetical protein
MKAKKFFAELFDWAMILFLFSITVYSLLGSFDVVHLPF